MYVVGVVETWEEGEVGCVCEVGEEAEECPWCVEEFVCSGWSVGRRGRWEEEEESNDGVVECEDYS